MGPARFTGPAAEPPVRNRCRGPKRHVTETPRIPSLAQGVRHRCNTLRSAPAVSLRSCPGDFLAARPVRDMIRERFDIATETAMKLVLALLFGTLLSVTAPSVEALAEKRVALVIGNSNYQQVKALANPEQDAKAFAALLRDAGFDVVDARTNLGSSEMRRALREFSDKVIGADMAVVYYAGHGIEIEGTNYLLPVDAVLKRDLDAEDEAVSLDRILRVLEPVQQLRLVILDACRDNPFVTAMRRTSATRAIGRGLAQIEPPNSNTLIAFAARAGSTAEDGTSQHSPFTAALLKHIAEPGLDLRIAFGRIRDEVLTRTGNRQEPFVYGSLGGTTVSLVPPRSVARTAPAPAAKTAPAIVDPSDAMRRDYELAVEINTLEIWDSFLKHHNTGFYADLARAQRERILSEQKSRAASATPAPPPATERTAPLPVPPVAAPAPSGTPGPTAALPPAPPEPRPAAAPEPASPASPAANLAERTRLVLGELKRLGCYSGEPGTVWDRRSQRAMEQFNRHAGLKLDTKIASLESVGVLKAKPTRVCPLECGRGFRAKGDACVRIACPRGQVPGNDGECEARRPSRNTAAKPPAQRPAPAARQAPKGGSQPERVVCGQTGCFPVKRGCSSEIRPSGHGSVAVVTCP